MKAFDLTELRQYAIIPESADQAQEVADWLVSINEDVWSPEKTSYFFDTYQVFVYDMQKWILWKKDWVQFTDLHTISATALLAKYRNNQMSEVEYWRTRCELAEKYIEADLEETYKAYQEFLNNNPR
jgi:hypothetical protein